MTVRYCGPGGSDAASGLSWALRKLTLNGVEDTPVAAGDTVYVGPGTYRETLTVDVSGSAGNLISYIGDYLGTNTDGVGGLVRWTGSTDDKVSARNNCISATSKDYRLFSGFLFDTTTQVGISAITSTTGWTIQNCAFQGIGTKAIDFFATSGSITVQDCLFQLLMGQNGIYFEGSGTVDNTGSLVQNCIFIGGNAHVVTSYIGGITVKNCTHLCAVTAAIWIATALTAGQTLTVNNCLVAYNLVGLKAVANDGSFVEDYNNVYKNSTDRSSVNTGAHSVAYAVQYDPRWFLQSLYAGAGPNNAQQVITPFDLASFSQLINLAGTSPVATDMRGTGSIGAQREWGALEYDATLKIRGGVKKSRVFTGGF